MDTSLFPDRVLRTLTERARDRVAAAGIDRTDPHYRALVHWALCGEATRLLHQDYRAAFPSDLTRWRERHAA